MKPSSKGVDIVAYVGDRAFSRLIQFWTRSRFSHVGMLCECDGREYVLESLEGKGVRMVPLTHWLTWPGSVVGWKFDSNLVGDVDRQHMVNWCAARLGCEYSSPRQFVRSFGLISRAIARLFRLRIDIETDRFFCSELIAHAIDATGFTLQKDPSEMSPRDITEMKYLTGRVVIKE